LEFCCMDFTWSIYRTLLLRIKESGYSLITFEEFMEHPVEPKVVVLRHDVDLRPENALRMATLEHGLGIRATYYFRVIKQVWNEEILKQIVTLGHEVAYHYEDLAITKGNFEQAILHFQQQLTLFRTFYPTKTICMHGSPLSKWDNRKLWQKFDYHDFGIIGEPYFDVDYNKVFYLSDTGRGWNRTAVSLRDNVISRINIPVKNTAHLIELFNSHKMPGFVIINIHPQRWFDPGINWLKELILQNLKNSVKFLIKRQQIQ
jgi:hypothetical protein